MTDYAGLKVMSAYYLLRQNSGVEALAGTTASGETRLVGALNLSRRCDTIDSEDYR